MTKAAFLEQLAAPSLPADLSPALQVLWYAHADDWERAHDIAQEMPGSDGAWLHAYLHRWEGDTFNAGYWYRRAGRPVFTGSLADEWAELTDNFTTAEEGE
jgi:hypothetical protein